MVFEYLSAQLDTLCGPSCGLALNPIMPPLRGPHVLLLIRKNDSGAKTEFRVVVILRWGKMTPIVIPSSEQD